jgi:flagellar biosynthetic protein FlhB
MAAEDEGRTEKPTGKRRGKAREEGQVAISKEIIGVAVLGTSCAVLFLDPAGTQRALVNATSGLFSNLDKLNLENSGAWLGPVVGAALLVVLPVAIVGAVSALISGLSQTNFMFAAKRIKPNFRFMKIHDSLKKMFISKQAATTILTALGKVSVIGLVTYAVLSAEVPTLATLGQKELGDVFAYMSSIMLKLVIQVGALLLIFAIIDFVLNQRRHEEQLKMKKQEVQDERKNAEGDPQVKGRQRAKMREVNVRLRQAVASSNVVIVNPTHYAVAIRYVAGETPAPLVMAKGKDAVAARIREIARENRIPIMHNPPLTRAIYKACEPGTEVPPSLYSAVATVLATLFKLRGGLGGAAR